ncbi:maleylpyruvate isomerase family mycothiol-dependent enzyme [Geodermatophilus sp. URMC 61]|uniref:maleylpyruvate isomerase family mycothiol-dependent enzyme n=1 Tax=Geodermatophilus sp. URMC 61 TaxID=3423411 RepID=UPI00406C4178
MATTRRWMDQGTRIFSGALARTRDDALAGPTALPGWTGRHLVAHVAANAEALLNLAHWARTGEETPMYSSPGQRDADIAAGARRAPGELRREAEESASRLAAALDRLTDEQWSRTIRTAQGRQVPASEIPWLRAREVMVHAVDLDPALSMGNLPEEFLLALADDVVAKRSGTDCPALVLTTADGRHTWKVPGRGEPTELHGSLGAVVTHLTGRPGADVTAPSGAVPDLPPWL